MGEYAKLTIRHNLKNATDIYREIYPVRDNHKAVQTIAKRHGKDPMLFGTPQYFHDGKEVFYEACTFDPLIRPLEEDVCKYNMRDEWFMCFSYDEMSVIGLDMGVFEAETTVEKVCERLSKIQFPETELDLRQRVSDLWYWIRSNAEPNDRIHMSSDWIYYSQDGKYDIHYVKKDVNQRIKSLKQRRIYCPHWERKKKSTPREPQFVQEKLF